MFRVWAAKEEVSVELNFVFAKIRTLDTGTQFSQWFSFVMSLPAIERTNVMLSNPSELLRYLYGCDISSYICAEQTLPTDLFLMNQIIGTQSIQK